MFPGAGIGAKDSVLSESNTIFALRDDGIVGKT